MPAIKKSIHEETYAKNTVQWNHKHISNQREKIYVFVSSNDHQERQHSPEALGVLTEVYISSHYSCFSSLL